MRRLLLVWLLPVLLCGSLLNAQQPRIEASLSKKEIYLGESLQFEILIHNTEREVSPNLNTITNCTVKSAGSRFINESSTRVINGQITQHSRRGFMMRYQITPLQTGMIELSGITAMVKGRMLTAPVVRVNVIGPQDQDFVILNFNSDKTRVTIYEEFTLQMDILIKQLPKAYATVEPLFPASPPTVTCDIFTPQPADGLSATNTQQFLQEMIQQRRAPGFHINDFTLQTGPFNFGGFFGNEAATFKLPQSIVTNTGIPYYAYSFSRRYIATDTGVYDFPAATFKGVIPTGIDRDGAIQTNIFASSDSIRVVVSSPEGSQSRPSYTGAIGTGLTARAELNLQTCSEGDPLTLDLHISGAVNPEDVRPLKLSRMEALTALFDVYDDNVKTTLNGGDKTFSYTIRPRKSGTIEVPPLEITYYDLVSRSFETISTRAIPIRVNKSHQISTADILNPGSTNRVGTTNKKVPELALSAMSMSSTGITTHPLAENWHWQTAVAGPGAFTIIMLIRGLSLFYRKRETQRKSSAALQRAHHLIDEAASLQTQHGDGVDALVLEAMRLIIGQQLGRPPESLTPDDLIPSLFHFSDFSQEEVDQLSTLFENCFNAGFAKLPATIHHSDITLVARLIREVQT